MKFSLVLQNWRLPRRSQFDYVPGTEGDKQCARTSTPDNEKTTSALCTYREPTNNDDMRVSNQAVENVADKNRRVSIFRGSKMCDILG